MIAACPPLSAPVPSVVVPSMNVTVPDGVPLPGGVVVTVAVKVTDPAKVEGFVPELTLVVVLALLTVCVSVLDGGLALKLPSPPYVAVTECEPTPSDEVVKVACADPLSVPVPSVATPSLNVTVPVGVPVPGEFTVTVAVNVTDWPNTDGFVPEATLVVVSALFS